MKKFLICSYLLFLIGLPVSSLEIDEKLTLRILNISSTKKTLLSNRGLEDGLVVGDHAKFFLTTGVIARGVVVKASPSRSIWSIYRLVDGDAIEKDKVVKIKISSPVKITVDPSKMIEEEDRVRPREVMVENSSPSDKEDLAELKKVSPKRSTRTTGKLEKKTWEVWGMVHGSSLSGTLTRDTLDSIELSGTFIDASVGIEKYVGGQASGILSHISVDAFIEMVNAMSSGANGESNGFQFGLGVNYHFGPSTAMTKKMIWLAHVHLGLAMPMSLTTESTGSSSSTSTGSGYFAAAGGGVKYYMDNGFGVRGYLEYYMRSETYEIEGANSWSNSLSGFRAGAGISYRF